MAFLLSLFSMFFVLTILFYNKNAKFVKQKKKNIFTEKKKKNLQTINAGEDVEMHSWWGYKLIQPLWRTVWRFLKKLEIKLLYDSAIPLLGIYSEKIVIA